MGLYNPIITHSEKNSNDVKVFSDNFHTPFHYWTNAITSRYWFSQFELLKKSKEQGGVRLGTYIRDTTGTREYRKDIISYINETNPNIFCPYINGGEPNSDASASIEWGDHTKFDIQIVPETLFDTEKTHLTEKVFKPIVMHQPFILFAGAHSLKYMKEYGFKTFGDIWDESYDEELNSTIRFNKIIKLLTDISELSNAKYTILINKTNSIVEFNRCHFYSDSFKKILIDELINGFEDSLKIQEESFYTFPGGTLFHYCNLYDIGNRKDEFKKFITPSLHIALNYVNQKSKNVGGQIIKKYNHLL
jgi:hypothetical protein